MVEPWQSALCHHVQALRWGVLRELRALWFLLMMILMVQMTTLIVLALWISR